MDDWKSHSHGANLENVWKLRNVISYQKPLYIFIVIKVSIIIIINIHSLYDSLKV